MPRKTNPRKTARTINKSAFVRGLPPSMSAADVVKAAAAKGIKLSDKFVHTIRYNAKVKAQKSAPQRAGGGGEIPIPLTGRGPSRPRRLAGGEGAVGSGIVGEIERIVEAAVSRLLNERLGALFGR